MGCLSVKWSAIWIATGGSGVALIDTLIDTLICLPVVGFNWGLISYTSSGSATESVTEYEEFLDKFTESL